MGGQVALHLGPNGIAKRAFVSATNRIFSIDVQSSVLTELVTYGGDTYLVGLSLQTYLTSSQESSRQLRLYVTVRHKSTGSVKITRLNVDAMDKLVITQTVPVNMQNDESKVSISVVEKEKPAFGIGRVAYAHGKVLHCHIFVTLE